MQEQTREGLAHIDRQLGQGRRGSMTPTFDWLRERGKSMRTAVVYAEQIAGPYRPHVSRRDFGLRQKNP